MLALRLHGASRLMARRNGGRAQPVPFLGGHRLQVVVVVVACLTRAESCVACRRVLGLVRAPFQQTSSSMCRQAACASAVGRLEAWVGAERGDERERARTLYRAERPGGADAGGASAACADAARGRAGSH